MSYEIAIDAVEISVPINLSIHKFDLIDDFKIVRKSNVLYLDYDKLEYPLTLRRWQDGDWFTPFGMKGKKKLSDFFSDNKFSLIDKENTWILCSGTDIVWIVDHRSDERYKISSETKKILKIELNKI